MFRPTTELQNEPSQNVKKIIMDHPGVAYMYNEEYQSVAFPDMQGLISYPACQGVPELLRRIRKHIKEFQSDEDKLEFTICGNVNTADLAYLAISLHSAFDKAGVVVYLDHKDCTDAGKPESKAALFTLQQMRLNIIEIV